MPPISAIVITYNEEANIVRCLQSLRAISDEIIVVDSHSGDRTVEMARALGATVIVRDWPGYGLQKQFALEQAKNDWVLSLDADEVVSDALAQEIRALAFDCDGYRMPRKVWYLNRWITHGGWYPDYVLRLFRKDRGRFTEKTVHESAAVTGRIGRLKSDLLHYSYRDVAHHIEKMNDFTSLAAREMFDQGRRVGVHSITIVPALEFLKMYVQKRGFLDGLAGLIISMLHGIYVFLKYAKLMELKMNRNAAPHAPAVVPTAQTDSTAPRRDAQ